MSLRYRENGMFTIVQFTDLHIGEVNGEEVDKDTQTLKLMQQVIEAERPDLIVITGDLIWSLSVADPLEAVQRAVAPVQASGIPWACVLGNHDAEGDVTREMLLKHLIQHNNRCIAALGPPNITGSGNYVLTIKEPASDRDAAILYFMDSGAYGSDLVGGYEWIHWDQINWYMDQSYRMKKRNGGTLPALAFFHIPLPEYNDAWKEGSAYGNKYEQVECARVNSGLFTVMLEAGDVMGTFSGHDHDNDYCGELHGIQLCYGRVTGYNTYGRMKRGARIIRMRQGERRFDTWIRQDDGSIIQQNEVLLPQQAADISSLR